MIAPHFATSAAECARPRAQQRTDNEGMQSIPNASHYPGVIMPREASWSAVALPVAPKQREGGYRFFYGVYLKPVSCLN
jgi:hypothetical protein